MTTLYFAYSLPNFMTLDTAEPANSPYSLTWNVGRFLRHHALERSWAFKYVNLDDTTPRTFTPDDIVIGHLWHTPGSFMRQALEQQACPVYTLQPYSHGMVSPNDAPEYCALFARATHNFWVTGRAWFETIADSPFAALAQQSTRLDMAVNPSLHPYSKTTWGKSGRRGVLAIGVDIPAKGLDRVAELAQTAGFRLGYLGNADGERFANVPQFTHHGGMDLTPDVIRELCAGYDFFITLGRMDANPTTLLETSAWGLIAFANTESGYLPEQPFLELRGHDLLFNWEQIERWQQMPEYDLRQRSEQMRQLIEHDYTWDKFCSTLWEGIAREHSR